eukprot:COSAG05_NODE_1897_length_3873_cov_28.019873_6_plen_84_part_00
MIIFFIQHTILETTLGFTIQNFMQYVELFGLKLCEYRIWLFFTLHSRFISARFCMAWLGCNQIRPGEPLSDDPRRRSDRPPRD